ncbi:MAG: antitoxin VapB family protein [Candidatus Woesearchaeota archaeon]
MNSGITTIPIKKETRNKLRKIASKSESWNDVIDRLYENTLIMNATRIFFEQESLSYNEAVEEIRRWK